MENKKILVSTNTLKDKTLEKTKQVISFLNKNNVQVYVDKNLYNKLELNIKKLVQEFENEQMFCCIVLGGDGTFLSSIQKYYSYQMPFVGINLGRVGYLSETSDEHIEELLQSILDGKYDIQEKSYLNVTFFNENNEQKTMFAFNEVVIHRGLYPKMLKMEIKINNGWQHSFYADGVLVATTMGSSAYNLSAGGPLLLPQAKCFAITSICSQFGIMPSTVVSEDDVISILSQESSNECKPLITIDGEEQQFLLLSKEVIIKKAKQSLYIMNIKNSQITENHISKMFNGYMK